MERVLQNTPATISASWYEDGVLVDPGTVTVTVDREDGTNLVTGQSTSGTGAAARTFTLSAAQTGLLDQLRATWTSPSKGTIVTYAEIVGGFLFSLAQARQDQHLKDTALYPTSQLVDARTVAEDAFERACRVAFVPRYARETLDGTGNTHLFLPHPRALRVRAATVDDVPVADVTAIKALRTGELYWADLWPSGVQNVTVIYEHGHLQPPGRVSQAVLLLAKTWLVSGPASDRLRSWSTPDGQFQILPASDGKFGIHEVDAVVDAEAYRLIAR